MKDSCLLEKSLNLAGIVHFMMTAPKDILKQYFGYDSFRPGQEEIIQSVLDGNDTLALMPTGGGKSVCYQIPALATEGICLVITPLIALMKDQVMQLRKRNISALAIHSGMTFYEVKKAIENACTGHFKFLYLSPERLQTKLFREYLPAMPVNLVAVDEAHCISQWGYDFRPPYLKIADLRTELPHVPILALTASATKRVQDDIIEKLQFSITQKVFRQSFARPNLSFSAFNLSQKTNKLFQVLMNVPGSALVYCRNRKRTREIAELLLLKGITASYYHAGLTTEERNNRQENWLNNRIRVMVCTNAFGMGIDKPDVRCVVHTDVPDSLEAYYQEAGRAGRDGKRSYAVLLYTSEELEALRMLPAQKFLPIANIRKVYQDICNYLQLPVGAGEEQYFNFNLSQFCESFKTEPAVAMNALKALETAGYLSFSEQVLVPARVQVVATRDYIEQLENDKPALEPIIKLLLRTYEGILDYPVSIREKSLAHFLQTDEANVVSLLKQLTVYQAIEYQPLKDTPQLYLMYNRVVAEHVQIDQQLYALRKQHYTNQVEAMVAYAANNNTCRSSIIRKYFGDDAKEECGICDYCLSKKQKSYSDADVAAAQQQMLAILKKSTTPLQLRRQCLHTDSVVFDLAFQKLQEEELIIQQPDGTFVVNQ